MSLMTRIDVTAMLSVLNQPTDESSLHQPLPPTKQEIEFTEDEEEGEYDEEEEEEDEVKEMEVGKGKVPCSV